MYWRNTEMGAPPQDAAELLGLKSDPWPLLTCSMRATAMQRLLPIAAVGRTLGERQQDDIQSKISACGGLAMNRELLKLLAFSVDCK